MFERFTPEARQVVVGAQEEARALKHRHIGTEHLLLALLASEAGLASRALEALEVKHDRARSEIVGIVGRGDVASPGQMPFTPRAKGSLERALRAALRLGHNYIGPEHVLLGVAAEREGVAARVLLDLGADYEKIREQVLRLLPDQTPEQRTVISQGTSSTRHAVELAWFDGTGAVLNRLARELRQELGREPDGADLLIVLASVPDGMAARVLAEFGIGVERLRGAVDRVRVQTAGALDVLQQEIDEVRSAKEAAIAGQQFEPASQLRDHERKLSWQAAAARAVGSSVGALAAIREHLGLPTHPDEAA